MLDSSKSVIIWKNEAWSKVGEDEDNLSDVGMGSYSGAEICMFLGSSLLNRVKESGIFSENGGLGIYRDDLLCYERRPIRNFEHEMKSMVKEIFKDCGLALESFKIGKTIESLDIKLSLVDRTFSVYRKPNDVAIYVDKRSNHSPTVIKEIPKGVYKRINKLSSGEAKVNHAKVEYDEVLSKAGNDDKLMYNEVESNPDSRKRRNRKIICITPPYNIQVRTNIGKRFFNILDECLKNTELSTIFNRNSVKLGYSSMRNINQIIFRA